MGAGQLNGIRVHYSVLHHSQHSHSYDEMVQSARGHSNYFEAPQHRVHVTIRHRVHTQNDRLWPHLL